MRRLTEVCLVLLFLSFVFGNSTSSSTNPVSAASVKTSEDPSKSTAPTKDALVETADAKDESGLDQDVTMDELLSSESHSNERKVREGSRNSETAPRKYSKDDIDATSATVAESRLTTSGAISLRRQGEITPELGTKQTGVQVDNFKKEVKQNPPPRFGQKSRVRNTAARDATPLLQLIQGGYQRPYQRLRNRQKPDSSEQSEELKKADENSNADRQPTLERIVPQVTYTNLQPRLTPYGSGPVFERGNTYGPVSRPAFQVPQLNQVPAPTPIQNGLLYNPPAGILDYTPPAFRSQFPPSNEIGYVSFSGEPNNAVVYNPAQRNPFQNAGLLFQGVPQIQQQPIFIDPVRNIQPQPQIDPTRNVQGRFPGYISPTHPNSDNAVGNSGNNFASFFSNPNINARFQLPANFYDPNANGGIKTPNNQPVRFLSNFPYPEDRLSSRFLRYPASPLGSQNWQSVNQNTNDQQPESDKKAKGSEPKEHKDSVNGGNILQVPSYTRPQDQNQDDFYIRYPTNEAGYAVKENLPPQNGSQAVQDDVQPSPLDQGGFPTNDPYRDALNAVRNQSQNRTQFVPEELFKNVPIDFGYQRPQNQIFGEHPGRNRNVPRYQTPDFDSRAPINPLLPLSENSHPFFNSANPRQSHPTPDEAVPSCTKQKNVSFCFKDDEYPRNDILYSINSNSYLADRLFSPSLDLRQLESVDQDSTDQVPEQYACKADSMSGVPLRAKNMAGSWRIIVNVGRFSQPLRMEVCRSTGDPCNYASDIKKTSCEQKFNLQRLLTWSPGRGLVADVFKIPVACSCRIIQAPTA